ncbi:unnamed protein product [Calicophoron daubneyi]|uniref:Beta-1,3-galactosyl-O-glycosyl-glycoprotein beta-1,6-N-acetylglucosaminyltransferase n=1 Tax=Calicophoron daubneyi TaxID=300641 RepID=A0AAV2TWU6_CALDB
MRRITIRLLLISFILTLVAFTFLRLPSSVQYSISDGNHTFNHLCENALNSNLHPNQSRHYKSSQLTRFSEETNCNTFNTINGQPIWNSPEEVGFPIAYAISAYESFDKLSRLLRLIYRPQNFYCIHVDKKSARDFVDSVSRLIHCFRDNVILVPDAERVNVKWGYFSVLQTTLLCAEMLIDNFPNKWRYMLNLNEKEFPLRTNWELVRVFKAINGSNMVEGIQGDRFRHRFPSHNFSFPMKWVKGSLLVALRYEFVHFMLHDAKALEIISSMKAEQNQLKVHDELFFSTLAYYPYLGAPGACLEVHPISENDPRSWFLTRYANWDSRHCRSGLAVHDVCILGVNDLPHITKLPHLFLNKFIDGFQPLAYDCMEYWFEKKLRHEYLSRSLAPDFNQHIYSDLYCSKFHN